MSAVKFAKYVAMNFGAVGEDFSPNGVSMVGDDGVRVFGSCPKFDNEQDELFIESRSDGYYWVDFTHSTYLGRTVLESYQVMIDQLELVKKTDCLQEKIESLKRTIEIIETEVKS
ncbi:MAG TPA: hypothetical protein EYQ00_09610 [Dehalococcoidia bacterium]|nr:hypothetical protein [Dehalococcoidia bacterium]